MRMQRQSQEKPVNQPSPAAESTAAAASSSEENEFKTEKLTRLNSKVDRSIHLIPLITFLCILILYLYSHDPKDLVTDGGFSATLDSQGISATEMTRILGRQKAGSESVGSRRALKKDGMFRHRKLGKSP